jgi:hypothetical protein
MTEIDIKTYKKSKLPTNPKPNSVYYILPTPSSKVIVYITDQNGVPKIIESEGAIDLSYIANPTNGIVTSDTGTDATIPLANNTNAGLLTPAEKTKISTALQSSDLSNLVPYTGATTNVDLGEFQLKAGQIELDQTPTGAFGVGKVRWNDTDGTIEIMLKGGNVTLQVGQEQVLRVVNKTGSNLLESEYHCVYISGAQGNRLKVDLALSNNTVNSNKTIGLVTENINNNLEGFVTTVGLVRGIDTTGSLQGETWADGDVLYLSAVSAGSLTNVAPTTPNHKVVVGYIVRAHITQGSIFVKVDTGLAITELHDVNVTGLTANKVIGSTTEGIWANKTIPEILGYTPANIASPTFTGIPTAPTATVGTNTTQLATTAFVLANASGISLSANNIWTGIQTYLNGTLGLRNVADTFTSFFTNTNTASRTYNLPNRSMTVAGTDDIAITSLDEGNGIGYVISGRNAANYGSVGLGAVDLSTSDSASSTKGATAPKSTVSGGLNNTAENVGAVVGGGESNLAASSYDTIGGGNLNTITGSNSTIGGGQSNTINAGNATIGGGNSNNVSSSYAVISGGLNNTLTAIYAAIIGGNANNANGDGSISGGVSMTSASYAEIALGTYGTNYTAGSTSAIVGTDRILNIGNGAHGGARSNAFTILKNGLATLPSVTNELITAEATGKAVVTKEYVNNFIPKINFKYPSEFTFRPFNIHEQQGIWNIDKKPFDLISDKVGKMQPYYVDYQNGSNSNNGLSATTAFKTIIYAINTAGARLIYTRGGDVIQSDGFGLISSTSGVEDIFIIKKGIGKTFILNNLLTPIFSLDTGTTYSTSVSGITAINVADFKFENPNGFKTNLEEVASLALVNSTPNSYWINTGTTTLYLNLKDGRVPDTNVFILKNSSDNRIQKDGGYVYNEGLSYMGGLYAYRHRGITTASAVSDANYLAENCDYLYSSQNGFGITDNQGVTWLNNCKAYRNASDGFNYSQGSIYTLSKNIETFCESFDNGYKQTVTSFHNGSSAHTAHTILRVAGKYYRNFGPNVIDVFGSHSLNVGVEAFESLGINDVANNPTTAGVNFADFGDFGCGTMAGEPATKMWLYGCKSKDSVLSFHKPALLSDGVTADTSILYVDNSLKLSPSFGAVTYGTFTFSELEIYTFSNLSASYTTPFYQPLKIRDTAVSSTVTGIAVDTEAKSYFIPAKTLNINDILDIIVEVNKTGAVGTGTYKIWKNTTNSFAGATQIATFTTVAANLMTKMSRQFTLRSNLLFGNSFTTSLISDIISTSTAFNNTTLNTEVDNYIFVSIALAGAADTAFVSSVKINN